MNTPEQLKILILAAEVVPFAKVGGLADVVGALPKALQELGHDVRVVMPRYGQIKPDRFKLTTVLDAVHVSMATFKEQVSVCQGEIGHGIPVYMS
ncbi:MAG TPA: glycogen/starch synthase, partial [Ktedonobacteraceae bacterium]